jgi:hypothetical protein
MKYYSEDQIKKNEMGRACGMYWREEKCVQDFGWKPEGEDNIRTDRHEVGWGAWTGLIWFVMGTGGGLLLRW